MASTSSVPVHATRTQRAPARSHRTRGRHHAGTTTPVAGTVAVPAPRQPSGTDAEPVLAHLVDSGTPIAGTAPLLSELIRTWPLPTPGWGRGYPPEMVHELLNEISQRVRRMESGLTELKSELTFLQRTLAQRDLELDQHRYSTRPHTGTGSPAGETAFADAAHTIDAAMAQAIAILDAAQRAAADEMNRAARSARAAQLYAHVITMKALRRAQRTPQAQHVAALQTELAYRNAQLTAVKEHVVAAAVAATFGSEPDRSLPGGNNGHPAGQG